MSSGLWPALAIVAGSVVIVADGARQGLPTIGAVIAMGAVGLFLVRNLREAHGEVEALMTSEARFKALVQQSSDVTLITTADGAISYASPSVAELFGQETAAIEGKALAALVHPDDAASLGRFLRAVAEGDMVVAEWRVKRGDSWVWTENTSTDLRNEPSIAGIVVNARDISERRSLEARLTHQAYHDSLTRLANRSLFLNRVAHAIARAPRGKRPSAVLFLDLDDFKKVNDSLGHAAGDELLVACAGRLATCVRPGDTIARLGGDEFAVLLEGIADMQDAIQIAERISGALRTSFTIHGRDVFVGVSLGLAEVTTDLTPDEALRNADLAMYFAKGQDKGRYAIYAPEMHTQLVERLELEADLRAAVDANQIEIEYQPIIHLNTGDVYGAEALVRWHHARRGSVAPSTFVAVAEETGLIIPVGQRVLGRACEQAQAWRTDRRRARDLQLSVNLSGRHFMEPTLLHDVRYALDHSGLEPRALTLEITESVLMQRSESMLEQLNAIKALGVRLAIDDFGTGYSSLGYLQRFPIDILKIDRSFVEAVAHATSDPVLVRAIIALGATLGIETIAEGIERVEQRDGLRALGCQLGQGYYFARSLTPAAFDAMLQDESERHVAHEPRRLLAPSRQRSVACWLR
ncbi:MAG: EAL domain-containing protein [Cytophagaceae bacterium]|nr:EAL domain-containing protein [Gemmatimonadaceae bacterium]